MIYTGLHQTPEMIAAAAVQEDVDIVGLSILSGAHNALVPRVIDLLAAEGAGDIGVFVGGVIPDDDVEALKKGGVDAVFTPGTSLKEIVEAVGAAVEKARTSRDK